MTYNTLYRNIITFLKEAGNEAPAFDTMCLFEDILGMNRHRLIVDGNREISQTDCEKITEAAQQRAAGFPLQYILGKWSFMGFDFFVGEGVLIPREDTSVAVNLCIDEVKALGKEAPEILDLCAGSGAISIALSKLIPESTVTAVELYEKAACYLRKNISLNKCGNVFPVAADVFRDISLFENQRFDVIVSNPPYIISSEIEHLQKEVRYEPETALDGGADGFDFYREIIGSWSRLLKKNGLMVFELGENQFDTVKNMLLENGFSDINYALDIQKIKRGISGIKYA